MSGFFDLGLPQEELTPRRRSSGSVGCDACGRWRGAKSPKLERFGEGRHGVLLVGESPSATDDRYGEFWQGAAGSFVRHEFDRLGWDIEQDCWSTYALRCHSTGKAEPAHIQACRPLLHKLIEELNPAVIIPMGPDAITTLLGDKFVGRLTGTKPSAFYGEQIPERDLGAWVCPVGSPGILATFRNQEEEQKEFAKHLKAALSLASEPPEFPRVKVDSLQLIADPRLAIEVIQGAENAAVVAFDYETTGLKPHRDGHKILTASLAYFAGGEVHAAAFPFFDDPAFRDAWRALLEGEVGKIAHKMDFEDGWTYWRGEDGKGECYWPQNWEWDTCLGAHVIDSAKPTGLKFHAYTKLGVIGYDDKADAYIKSTDKGEGSNAFNALERCPLNTLLEYNALDSAYTLMLYKMQREELRDDPHSFGGFRFFMRAAETLSKVQQAGMRVDRDALHETREELARQLAQMEWDLRNSPEARKIPGFNPGSNSQLMTLFYDILGYPEPRHGRKADDKALSEIGTPFARSILEWRKLSKLQGTYLAQYEAEEVDGVIRPFFNLHLVRTFRSSSDSPNFQNVPKRNEVAQRTVRTIFRPSPGNRLIEYDYKGVEVAVGAAYHQDPQMIKYITDPTTDMHRDVAVEMLMVSPEELTKAERHCAKNGFVFPSFYGSTTPSIAPNVWDMIPDTTRKRLKSKGIKNLDQFTEHIRKIEQDFWGRRFRGYDQWRQRIWKDYQRRGYVELYTGFRCYGPLKFTEATNYQIQGSAFHVLLWTLINVEEPIRKLSGRSRVVGQIHDAIVVDAHPDDESKIDALVREFGVEKVRDEWEWINVPLTVEKDASPVDGTWADMKGVGAV